LNACGDASDPFVSLRLLLCCTAMPATCARIQRKKRRNPARYFAAIAAGRSRRFYRGRALNGLTCLVDSRPVAGRGGKPNSEIEDHA